MIKKTKIYLKLIFTVIITLAFVSVFSVSAQPSLILTPDREVTGGWVNAVGSGFSGDNNLEIFFDYYGTPQLVHTVYAPFSGSFDRDVQIPEGHISGDYTVSVEEFHGVFYALDDFFLEARVELNPAEVVVSQTAQLTGQDFGPNEWLDVYLDGDLYRAEATETNTGGTFSLEIDIPEINAGTHTFEVDSLDSAGYGETSFTVIPRIELNRYTGPVGTVVTVNGYGFEEHGSLGQITIDGTDCWFEGPVWISTSGSFATDFVIPSVPSIGGYTITAIQTGGVLDAIATFEVTERSNFVVFPNFGDPGGDLHYFGTDYTHKAGEIVTIELGPGNTIDTATTDDNGEFSGTADIPLGISDDVYVARASQDIYGIESSKLFYVGYIEASVNPVIGSEGTYVTLSGSGFTATGTWDASIEGVEVITDEPVLDPEFGTISGSFYIPSVGEGVHAIRVHDDISGAQLLVPFEITESTKIELEPLYGLPGQTINIEGHNFVQILDEEVSLELWEKDMEGEMIELATFTVDEDGYFIGQFSVPKKPFHSYWIRAIQSDFDIKARKGFRIGYPMSAWTTMPPEIDGELTSPDEWDDADMRESTTDEGEYLAFYVKNDATNLYMLAKTNDDQLDSGDWMWIYFDNDHDHSAWNYEPGDNIVAWNGALGYVDGYTDGSTALLRDIDFLGPASGTIDGSGAAGNDGTYNYFEFSFPLDSTDDLHDFSLVLGDMVGCSIKVAKDGSWAGWMPSGNPAHFGDIRIATEAASHELSIFPLSGTTGSSVTIWGSGLSLEGEWDAVFSGIDIFPDVMYADIDGEIMGTFTVPLVSPGIYPITVWDVTAGTYASILFEVTEIGPIEGLVSWWSGDGFADDLIGENHGIERNGAYYSPGLNDDAFTFDGVDDWIDAPGTNIDDLHQLTIEAWVKLDSMDVYIDRFVTLTNEKAVLRHDGENDPGQLHFYMNFLVDGYQEIRVNKIFDTEGYHHVAATYDGKTMVLYHNGELLDSQYVGDIPILGDGVEINADSPECLEGQIDEVCIYNHALRPNEIEAIYLAGSERAKPIADVAFKKGGETPIDETPPADTGIVVSELVIYPVQAAWEPDIDDDLIYDLVLGKSMAVVINVPDTVTPTPLYAQIVFEGTTHLVNQPEDYGGATTLFTEYPIPVTVMGDSTITGELVFADGSTQVLVPCQVSVKPTNDVQSAYYALSHADYGSIDDTDGRWTEMVGSSTYFMESTYPTNIVTDETLKDLTGNDPGPKSDPLYGLREDAKDVATQAGLLMGGGAIGIGIGPDDPDERKDYFYAHGYRGVIGASWGPSTRGVLGLEKYWTVVAHEEGHVYDLWYGEPEQYETDPDNGIYTTGVWVDQGVWKSGYCYMGTGDSQTYDFSWVSSEAYELLFSAVKDYVLDPQIIFITGDVTETGFDLDSAHILEGTPDILVPGPYALRFLDGGVPIGDPVDFAVQFYVHLDPGPEVYGDRSQYGPIATDIAPIAFAVELPLGTDSIEVLHNQVVLDTITSGDMNHVPILTPIQVTESLVPIDTPIIASSTYTDPDTGDTHTATWDWGDGEVTQGTITPDTSSSGAVSGTHIYDTPGVYAVVLRVEDDKGGFSLERYEYVVVYDPSAGFVTGGGWIESPPGAYPDNPSLEGRASFGFVAKYVKGKSKPAGKTEFIFKVANLKFHSDNYEWLVIAGDKAMFKGEGTINGAGNYGFKLTAIDGDLNEDVDQFRIKIWHKETEEIIYDNKIGDSDDSEELTPLAGGSIIIHTKKKK